MSAWNVIGMFWGTAVLIWEILLCTSYTDGSATGHAC